MVGDLMKGNYVYLELILRYQNDLLFDWFWQIFADVFLDLSSKQLQLNAMVTPEKLVDLTLKSDVTVNH